MREVTDYRGQERTVESITVGVRHRADLGDLDPLMESIARVGLLQPITVTPEGVLVCGRRRLEAIRRLGWASMRVWVRSGISDKLSGLLAQQDENVLHKPLSPVEAAGLYRELKAVFAEDARRRQEATRFGAGSEIGEVNGAADSAAPRRGLGDARRQAASMVTSSASYQRLDRITQLQAVVDDETYPLTVRRLAESELDKIDAGAPVNPAYLTVMEAIEAATAATAADGAPGAAAVSRIAPTGPAPTSVADSGEGAAAPGRVAQPPAAITLLEMPSPAPAQSPTPVLRSTRSLVMTWADLDGWTQHHDPGRVAADLSDDEWSMFERVVAETDTFRDAVHIAREHLSNAGSGRP